MIPWAATGTSVTPTPWPTSVSESSGDTAERYPADAAVRRSRIRLKLSGTPAANTAPRQTATWSTTPALAETGTGDAPRQGCRERRWCIAGRQRQFEDCGQNTSSVGNGFYRVPASR